MPGKKPQRAYIEQKCSVRQRKPDINGNIIEFRLTFEEWWAVWEASGKYEQRGPRRGQYCMSRFNDSGHYEVGNVFIQLSSANLTEAHKGVERPERVAVATGRRKHVLPDGSWTWVRPS